MNRDRSIHPNPPVIPIGAEISKAMADSILTTGARNRCRVRDISTEKQGEGDRTPPAL